jgi:hypothetical protein
MDIAKRSIIIPFLTPIGTKTFSRLKKTATETGALDFSENFGGFYGSGYHYVRIKTEYQMMEEGA